MLNFVWNKSFSLYSDNDMKTNNKICDAVLSILHFYSKSLLNRVYIPKDAGSTKLFIERLKRYLIKLWCKSTKESGHRGWCLRKELIIGKRTTLSVKWICIKNISWLRSKYIWFFLFGLSRPKDRDSGTNHSNAGLSRRYRDTWNLCINHG